MGDDGTFIPKIKLSENSEKITNPGNKTVYRVYDADGMIKADLIALADETYDESQPLLLFDPCGNVEKDTDGTGRVFYAWDYGESIW